MAGLPSTKEMRKAAQRARPLNLKIGEAAIDCIGELLETLREFVSDAAATREGFGKYLEAFDRSVELEMAYLRGLPPAMKIEFGITLYSRGALDEMEALHLLLSTSLPDGGEEREKEKEKRKVATTTLKKELGDLWPRWLPDWLETIIESILELL